MASEAPIRRFKVDVISTSTKSSKDRLEQTQLENPKPVRRFLPQPVETTQRTNRMSVPGSLESPRKVPRRFAPQPIETTTRTNRSKVAESPLQQEVTEIETVTEVLSTDMASEDVVSPGSTRKSQKKFADEWEQEVTSPRIKPNPFETVKSGRRPAFKRLRGRFVPQLIETAQRSRKAGDNAPTLYPSDRTEATPDFISSRRARILGITPTPPSNTPTDDLFKSPLFLEVQQGHAACPLARRRSYFSSSEHSFRIPDLDTIESSESEESCPPSPVTSASDHSFMYKEATRRRESVDEGSSGYLLNLAAKAAAKQLREQAMAAFPNDDHHEPVAHYVDHDSDDDRSDRESGKGNGRSSFTEVNWELKAMRAYQEEQEAEKEKFKLAENIIQQDKEAKSAATEVEGQNKDKKAETGVKDPELACMRKSARPPMLGKDIRFPRCASPEPARFDTTQGCDVVRTAMCYLSEMTKAASEKGESLWCGQGNGRQTSTTPSLWSCSNSRASSTHGLWGGMCVNGGEKSPRGPTGILTPHPQASTLLSPCPTPVTSVLPPTPPASTADFSGIDEKLTLEQSITENFGDDFVTQVYNYLSLGYPSMARPFDEELSKISMIPIYELRQDDFLAESRGYIRLGKDGNLTAGEITEETCMRWRALRIYIQEWARQLPGMSEEEFLAGAKGMAGRKGSWAV